MFEVSIIPTLETFWSGHCSAYATTTLCWAPRFWMPPNSVQRRSGDVCSLSEYIKIEGRFSGWRTLPLSSDPPAPFEPRSAILTMPWRSANKTDSTYGGLGALAAHPNMRNASELLIFGSPD